MVLPARLLNVVFIRKSPFLRHSPWRLGWSRSCNFDVLPGGQTSHFLFVGLHDKSGRWLLGPCSCCWYFALRQLVILPGIIFFFCKCIRWKRLTMGYLHHQLYSPLKPCAVMTTFSFRDVLFTRAACNAFYPWVRCSGRSQVGIWEFFWRRRRCFFLKVSWRPAPLEGQNLKHPIINISRINVRQGANPEYPFRGYGWTPFSSATCFHQNENQIRFCHIGL